MNDARTVRVGRRAVALHRPEKILFPARDADAPARTDPGYTKADLFDYYRSVAPFMLPHLRGRPLMLERHPDGVDGPRFMQKDTPEHYPDWITRAEVAKQGGTVTHTVCDDTATLLFLADQACLTLHRWLSRTGRIDHPDRLVFDLDPAKDDFGAVRDAARLLGELLDHMGLFSALMTTGSRGLHVVVPLNGHQDFDDVRDFAKDVADTLAAAHPERFTTAARKRAATGSTSTCSATGTRRPPSPPSPYAPRRVRRWPYRSPGSSSTTRPCTPAAGPSRTPWSRPAPTRGPAYRAPDAPSDRPAAS